MKLFQPIQWGPALLSTSLLAATSLFLMPALTAAPFVPQDDDVKEEADDAKAEADDEEDGDKFLALVGGEIHTGLGGVLRDATLLVKNGKIESFGYDVEVPEDAEVVDASGMRVYPGLIAVGSFGLFGGGCHGLSTAGGV